MTLCILGSLLAVTATAQRISVGPEIGVTFNTLRTEWMDYDVDQSFNTGFKIGGIVDIRFSPGVSFQPGVMFVTKGSELKYTTTYTANSIVYRERIDQDLSISYLEIPLNIQFYLNPFRRSGFFIGGGPYLATAVGGEVDYRLTTRLQNGTIVEDVEDEYELEIGDDEEEDDIRRGDMGINLNLGYVGMRGFFFRANAGIGLSNIVPGQDDDFSMRNTSYGLSVGYLFGR